MTFMSDLLMHADFVDISELDLKDRDISLLHIVEEEDLTNFTFEGLKRRLKIHPEKLSRILSRLLSQEIVEKRNNGYVLTAKAKKILKSKPSESHTINVSLLQTFLPPKISINKIIDTLQNKWFGQLRWLGHSETKKGITLKWITTDGKNIISATFYQGKLQIFGKTVSNNNLNDALDASHQLMGYITKLITSTEQN
jgi:DNA-binding MarR family transcriptional regulator